MTRGELPRRHVITFVALGGEGKTSLVTKWAVDELLARGWPGCDAAFAWTFYRDGTDGQSHGSSDRFLNAALTFFGDPDTAASAKHPSEKGKRLAQLVSEQPALLILDGVEPLQHPPGPPHDGRLKDDGLAALLQGLAQGKTGLCIVTTRYAITDLKAFWESTAPQMKLVPLSRAAGVKLLQSYGVRGSLAPTITLGSGPEKVNEFEKLVEDVKGHALTLTLLGGFLRDGDIHQRERVKLEEADAEVQGGHAFRVMEAYEQAFAQEGEKGAQALALLRLVGFFDRPADAECLEALWTAPAIAGLTEPLVGWSGLQRNSVLGRLQDARLLTVNRTVAGALASVDAHPLVRAYFAKCLRDNNPDAWRAGHKRLYEHLCATTKEGDKPTLEDLQPLYQAVSHGCNAGLHREASKVYLDRILRGDEFYSTRKLGAVSSNLGAVACFFEEPWARVSSDLPEPDRTQWLIRAGDYLLALGRINEALDPMRNALEMLSKQNDLENLIFAAKNLCELELIQGNLANARTDAERFVSRADEIGDVRWSIRARATLAEVLFQGGDHDKAMTRFRETENIQFERHISVIHVLDDCCFCELLLDAHERAAWMDTMNIKSYKNYQFTIARQEIAQRVQRLMLIARDDGWLLDKAIVALVLGHTTFYDVLSDARSDFGEPLAEVDQAVTGLRYAGRQDHLPRGLLARAWLRARTGTHTGPDSAKADLDEAWEIAERGPMPLFLADIHLYRARLFFRESNYPWESPQHDLAEARHFIEKCGYGRRKEELEDAEKAILGDAKK